MKYLFALLLLAGVTLAQEIDSVRPECAAPGDYVLIQGSDFGEDPTVLFDDVEADVVKNRDDKILVRVPAEGLETGAVTIGVGTATADFTVLEAGAPIILHVSAAKATPGMVLIIIGARLAGGTAAFVDADDVTAATVDLRGGRRASFLKVPSDLAAGTYTLVITNPDEVDSGDCSPVIEIVEAGTATVTSITPDDQTPGRGVICNGTDLGPFGHCYVSWTDSEENTLWSWGFANGYDKVFTRVPFKAEPGGTYDVAIELADGTTTEAFSYEVGTLPAPSLTELEYTSGPAGQPLGIVGENLFSGHKLPKVEFTDADDVATEADVLWAFPHQHHHYGKKTSEITVRIPGSLADGEYDVTVTTGTGTSNALVFTVADLELTVTGMKPDGQGERGPNGPVVITGTGFGTFDKNSSVTNHGGPGGPPNWPKPDLEVTWDDGSDADPLRGFVLYHTDREIVVIPPGGWFDPLPIGEYTVRVVLHPDSDEPEIAIAGTYTVE
ncbi:MAG: IPT/TIG domain-containing protein [Planctomycetota bacterium]|jgi:hypothetical protein